MKRLGRTTASAAALVMAGLAAASCAPSTSDATAGADEKTGTVRVWLFQEVSNEPKKKIVDRVAGAFEKEHDGVDVEVTYIPVDTRAEKIKAAFNDPKSAPDLIEYGNTDTAGYVRDGGLAEIGEEFADWDEAKDTDPTAKRSVTVDGKIYGAPFFVGVRALYYRTDVFGDLGLKPPKTQADLVAAAKEIRRERPEMYGIAVGGAYTYGAMPFIWANGGELATERDGGWTAAIGSPAARKGIETWTGLFGDHNCPADKCAEMGGNDTVTAFASGKAGMAIGGDFSHQAMEDGAVQGKYGVVPLPGVEEGSIAPAFAGGNNLGVLKSTSHRTLAVELMKSLAGKETQRQLFEAMGFLPTFTDVREQAAREEPFVEPFVRTLDAGTEFVPASPGWAAIDSSRVLPTMFQEVVRGDKSVAEAAGDAADRMDDAFDSAS